MKTAVKVTTAGGNSWTTEINLTLAEAKNYFLNVVMFYTTENDLTGEETCYRIIKVEEV